MANRMYFGATVNGAFDIYRLAENDGMSRVALPDGVNGGLLPIGGTTPTFVTSTDGGELTLVRLAPSGLFSVVQDSGGAPIVIDDRAQITTDGDLIYFSGSVAGDLAIWRRELDGGLTKVTDLLSPGNLFEFNDGKLWIDATSTLGSLDGEAHAAAFAITPDGQIERMAELRTSKFAPNDNDSFNFDIVDATITDSFVAGGNVFYSYSRDAGGAFISSSDVLDGVTPTGDIISAGEAGQTLVDGAEIYTIVDNIFSEGPFLSHRNAETGASILSVRLGNDQFGD